jgi:hypothetical protein
LVPTVVQWFNGLRTLAAGSAVVFRKRRRDRRQRVPHVGIDTLNAALQRVKHGLPPFKLHYLRRAALDQWTQLLVQAERGDSKVAGIRQGSRSRKLA